MDGWMEAEAHTGKAGERGWMDDKMEQVSMGGSETMHAMTHL